ncbi:SAM-dependent methyltransferase [Streptomyces sp. NPDC097617]|uniref:SAM-dependent methyltransferase n=1 Tax=Streptomyces sp. NPDC097617 TaxID=3366091 RepID=UPI00380A2A93
MPPARPPRGADASVASTARMYDFFLDGKDHYPADLRACHRLMDIAPQFQALARAQRRFQLRAVRELIRTHKVTQFIDFGCGMPTRQNTHEVARRSHDASTVLYVDRDPMVVAHGQALLEEEGRSAVVYGDLRETRNVLAHPDTVDLIDFTKPVAVLLVSVLHCLPDEDEPHRLVAGLMRQLPAGSYLIASQLVSEDTLTRERVSRLMNEVTGDHWGRVRTSPEAAAFFKDMDIIGPPPGSVTAWQPESELDRMVPGLLREFGAVARKRE